MVSNEGLNEGAEQGPKPVHGTFEGVEFSGQAAAARQQPGFTPASAGSFDLERANKLAVPFGLFLKRAIEQGVSDIFVNSNLPITFCKDDQLAHASRGSISAQRVYDLIVGLADGREAILKKLAEHGSADFAIGLSLDDATSRFRCIAHRYADGVGIVMRLLPQSPKSIAEIGLPSSLVRLTRLPRGLILICGPTGSGKTTSLAALLQMRAEEEGLRIVTIEDPIEYQLKSARSLIIQREVGTHTPTFFTGLRDALRQAPKVIMVGEMRDPETIRAALTAAETGHLVFSTLHTRSAMGAITRILDSFGEHDKPYIASQLASSLKGVLCQTLLPRLDGNGRVAGFDLAIVTSALQNLIRSGKVHQADSYNRSTAAGHLPFDQHLDYLVRKGLISDESRKRALEQIKHDQALELEQV